MPGESEVTMNINTSYISNNNSYAGQVPLYIVIHNTDNYNAGANAKAHAKAQHDGNFSGMSAHIYADDKEAYQAMPYDRGAWHVGVNYGGRLFGIVNNRNSIGIEMCVNAGYDYEKAFQNTVKVCKQLMKQFGIPAERVVQHYDVCSKNCPSAIRAKNDWNRFKSLIAGGSEAPAVDKYYRIRKSWEDSKGQIGAYKSLENAKKDWKKGYIIYDWNGKQVYPEETKSTKTCSTTDPLTMQLPVIETGCTGVAVKMLQTMLGTQVTGTWNEKDVKAFKEFQKNTKQTQDGVCGENGWTAVAAHIRANTRK
ncbi:MAG: N-acetylmuramoyl-L-alanine amidase [Blautia sp.]|nr:N-acetylmuramoyl-L-alanine amidase [Blautia sp.]